MEIDRKNNYADKYLQWKVLWRHIFWP